MREYGPRPKQTIPTVDRGLSPTPRVAVVLLHPRPTVFLEPVLENLALSYIVDCPLYEWVIVVSVEQKIGLRSRELATLNAGSPDISQRLVFGLTNTNISFATTTR
jgi:hypothetical protein